MHCLREGLVQRWRNDFVLHMSRWLFRFRDWLHRVHCLQPRKLLERGLGQLHGLRLGHLQEHSWRVPVHHLQRGVVLLRSLDGHDGAHCLRELCDRHVLRGGGFILLGLRCWHADAGHWLGRLLAGHV